MITASEAYKNYLEMKKCSDVEKFVISVCEDKKIDELITGFSYRKTKTYFSLETIFNCAFYIGTINGHWVYTAWKYDLSKLPDDVYGNDTRKLIKELKEDELNGRESAFITKAINALRDSLEKEYGYKVEIDLKQAYLIISWDLSNQKQE